MTIREHKGKLMGLKACWIGDGNNVANSMIVGCLKSGMDVSVACPEGYRPDKQVLDFAATVTGCKFELTEDPKVAAAGADAVFTDVWASMGQEGEAEKRQKAFKGYQVNDEIMALTNPGNLRRSRKPTSRPESPNVPAYEKTAGLTTICFYRIPKLIRILIY
jgi:ornithine carbamoyltransferase